jgi:hypothetical protein
MLVLESKKESVKLVKSGDGLSDPTRVPKNGVSRSKRLMRPQPIPHQYRVLELRTSLTKAGDGAKCGAKFADTPHVIYIEVTGVRSESKEHPPKVYIGKNNFLVFLPPMAARTQIGE